MGRVRTISTASTSSSTTPGTRQSVTAPAGGIVLSSGDHYSNAIIDASGLTAGSLFSATSATDVTVENCKIINLAKTKKAATFTGCTRPHFSNNEVTSGGWGVMFDACDDAAAIGNTITLTTDAGSGFIGYGILYYANVADHSGARIIGNTIHCTGPYSHGISGWGSDSSVLANPIHASDIVVSGNQVLSAFGGIWFSKCQRVSVTGNTISSCTDVGVDFEGCLDWSATGNTIKNAKAGALAALYNSKRGTFSGNQVSNDTDTVALGGGAFTASTWIAVYLRDTCEDIVIEGNVFASTVASSKTGEIQAWKNAQSEASRRITVRGNTFYNVYVNFEGVSRDVVIDGNRVYFDFDPEGALFVGQSNGIAITNNRLSLAADSAKAARGGSPISVYQSSAPSTPRVTNVLIEGNQILNWPSVGIEVDTYNGTDYTATFVIRDNEASVIFTRTSAAATKLISGNVLATAPQTASTLTTW